MTESGSPNSNDLGTLYLWTLTGVCQYGGTQSSCRNTKNVRIPDFRAYMLVVYVWPIVEQLREFEISWRLFNTLCLLKICILNRSAKAKMAAILSNAQQMRNCTTVVKECAQIKSNFQTWWEHVLYFHHIYFSVLKGRWTIMCELFT